MKGIIRKDNRAFTGVESAIVLTAFLVVAAAFSYVIVGAGLTSFDTDKENIDEGVNQATSSVELAGDVIAKEGSTDGTIDKILLTLQLIAGQSPVDIGADSASGVLVVSYADSAIYEESTTWSKSFVGNNDTDNLLEQYEKVQLEINVPAGAELTTATTATNSEFRLEVKPNACAIVQVTRITPAQIDPIMILSKL